MARVGNRVHPFGSRLPGKLPACAFDSPKVGTSTRHRLWTDVGATVDRSIWLGLPTIGKQGRLEAKLQYLKVDDQHRRERLPPSASISCF